MEHGFGLKGYAWKNYYLTLQVSQLLNDLVRFGDFLQKITDNQKATFQAVFGTMRSRSLVRANGRMRSASRFQIADHLIDPELRNV